jgi:hypothetical protein
MTTTRAALLWLLWAVAAVGGLYVAAVVVVSA